MHGSQYGSEDEGDSDLMESRESARIEDALQREAPRRGPSHGNGPRVKEQKIGQLDKESAKIWQTIQKGRAPTPVHGKQKVGQNVINFSQNQGLVEKKMLRRAGISFDVEAARAEDYGDADDKQLRSPT